MKVDLKAKKTEYEWQITLDNFWLKATPLWFDWLKWTAILGGITYLSNTTHNTILNLTSGLSYLLLLCYLQSYFYSINFMGFPFIKSKRITRIISLILSAIISYSLFLFLNNLASQLHGK